MTVPSALPPLPSGPPPPAVGDRSSARWREPLIIAVAAGGAGVGLGWLLWAGGGGAASGTGLNDARADAVGSCQVLPRTPGLDALYEGPKDSSEAYFNRLGAASQLAHSAAVLDDRYEELDKAMREIMRRMQTFDVKDPGATATEKKARALCAEYEGQ
ncbi:hypothetical protein ACFY93_06300 [Streptomyces sp. NPDC008313]|uniref:hypothetical protein n=1 Tax=Streptomyces sp. NPDC008313 TaxID=3364826 RepID=UPI0036E1C14E